ncbi:hypothetical protein FKM82_022412 [Ascaphus truei]
MDLTLLQSKFLKLGTSAFAKPIASIINSILSAGHIPKTWKTARVVPIFKNGDKNTVSNYKSISLLPIHTYSHSYLTAICHFL